MDSYSSKITNNGKIFVYDTNNNMEIEEVPVYIVQDSTGTNEGIVEYGFLNDRVKYIFKHFNFTKDYGLMYNINDILNYKHVQ